MQPEIMADGTQVQVRNDMMSNANLQDAANVFNQNWRVWNDKFKNLLEKV